VTNSSGVASVTYTAPANTSTTALACTITAEDSIYGQSGTGIITNSTANTVTASASPTSVTEGDSGSTPVVAAGKSTVTAVVTPVSGSSADNITVDFTMVGAVCGTLSASSGSTGPTDTAVSVTYTASTGATPLADVGFCTITAKDTTTLATGTVTIDQTEGPAIFPPSLTFSPTSASVTESTANANLFEVTVANSSGGIANDPLEATVTGTGCPTAASAVSFAPAATNPGPSPAIGTDEISYLAGSTATTCVVTVTEAAAGSTGSVTVTQAAAATKVTVTAVPPTSAPGGTVDLTVLAANPSTTDIGGAVTFTVTPVSGTSCGAVPASTTLASSDYAYSTYVAGSGVGFCTITATLADGTSGSTTVDQT
jgi:hypothetical protein